MGDITAAVLREAEVSVGSAQYFVAALRAFLRYLFLEGLLDKDLSTAALAEVSLVGEHGNDQAVLGQVRRAHPFEVYQLADAWVGTDPGSGTSYAFWSSDNVAPSRANRGSVP